MTSAMTTCWFAVGKLVMVNVPRAAASSCTGMTSGLPSPSMSTCVSVVRVIDSVKPPAMWKPATVPKASRALLSIGTAVAWMASFVAPAGMSIDMVSSTGTRPPSAPISAPRSMRPG